VVVTVGSPTVGVEVVVGLEFEIVGIDVEVEVWVGVELVGVGVAVGTVPRSM